MICFNRICRTGQLPLGASQKVAEGGEVGCISASVRISTYCHIQQADVVQLKREPSTNPITDEPDAKRMKREDE